MKRHGNSVNLIIILAGLTLALTATGQETNQPPRHRVQGGPGKYAITQATSDCAQLNTIAFDGLAFPTGGFNEDTFLPPGIIPDFFGFQNMRDIDGAAVGHNTDFLFTAVP